MIYCKLRFKARLLQTLCLALILPLTASASTDQQRALYKQATEQLTANEMERYFQLKARLTGYPLYPYLEQKELEHNFNKVTQHHIDLYLQRYTDIPAANLLQQRWLRHLAAKKHWKRYRIAFDKHPVAKELFQCHYRNALLKTGQTSLAFKNIEPFWNQGHSISKACDSVFDTWTKKGKGPDSDLAYQRFWKAIDSNSISLARYLRRFISKPEQKKATATFFQIRNNPALIKQAATLRGDNIATQTSYLYGIERLSRKSPQTASKLWLKVRSELTIKPSVALKLNQTLARRVASKPDKNSDRIIAHLNHPLDQQIQTRRINLALTNLNWPLVYNLINEMPPEQQNAENWVYWKTIAASHNSGLKPEYSDAFLQLSKERSYYGLLAGQLLKTRFRLNPQQDRVDEAQLKQLADQDAIRRMHELYLLNELYLARREWNRFTYSMNKDQLRLSATLVHRWGWHSLAIRGIAQARYWDDIALRFPMPYENLFQRRAAKAGIDTNWARAIARQESAYQPYARSHVGARGLMQLMPKTASSTAKKNKVPYRRTSDLYNPETNISLGVAYLAEMQKRFNDNQVYATAAYNAGPHRVSRWLKERGKLPIDIWIETIPFNETRKYVKNVMAYHAVYRTLAGQPPHILGSQTAFRVAMQSSTGASQAEQLREYIQSNSFTTQTQ